MEASKKPDTRTPIHDTQPQSGLRLEDLRPRVPEKKKFSDWFMPRRNKVHSLRPRQVHGLRDLRDDLLDAQRREGRAGLRQRQGTHRRKAREKLRRPVPALPKAPVPRGLPHAGHRKGRRRHRPDQRSVLHRLRSVHHGVPGGSAAQRPGEPGRSTSATSARATRCA